jgi:hypothetical protein
MAPRSIQKIIKLYIYYVPINLGWLTAIFINDSLINKAELLLFGF